MSQQDKQQFDGPGSQSLSHHSSYTVPSLLLSPVNPEQRGSVILYVSDGSLSPQDDVTEFDVKPPYSALAASPAARGDSHALWPASAYAPSATGFSLATSPADVWLACHMTKDVTGCLFGSFFSVGGGGAF